ncbi:MAG: ectoine/hydroxyectoine ABC transporter substrate-binding protein EhuB [Guyparkeria sp.]
MAPMALGGVALLSACGDDSEDGNTMDRAVEQGFIRIAIANEPPYTEVNADGSVTGAAVEIPRRAFEIMGIAELQPTTIEYGSMIPGLQAGRFDVVTAGLFMTPERCEEVIYSEPDVCGTESFAVAAGNPLGLNSYEDVAAQSDAIVGVPGGSVEEEYAIEAGVPEERIEVIPDLRAGVDALKAGRIDAYGLPTASIRELLDGESDLEEAGPLPGIPIACAGAAFRQGDGDLREAYNQALEQMKDSGDFDDILLEFGFDPSAARAVTAEQLCAGEAPEFEG